MSGALAEEILVPSCHGASIAGLDGRACDRTENAFGWNAQRPLQSLHRMLCSPLDGGVENQKIHRPGAFLGVRGNPETSLVDGLDLSLGDASQIVVGKMVFLPPDRVDRLGDLVTSGSWGSAGDRPDLFLEQDRLEAFLETQETDHRWLGGF